MQFCGIILNVILNFDMKKLSHTFAFVWILINVGRACHPESKHISDNVTIACDSPLPITETVIWRFNNQTEVDSSFSSITLSKPYGRSVAILSGDVSVYGDYSCSFANGSFINCFSLYIQGQSIEHHQQCFYIDNRAAPFYYLWFLVPYSGKV